jgi:predicted N-acetyltransferase YhbS
MDCGERDLIYDKKIGPPSPGAREFGTSHYRNSPKIWYRAETEADAATIEALIAAAFLNAEHTSHTEQFIVTWLRKAGALTLSLVADMKPGLVGHVAVSPVTLSDGTTGWYGLGPVSVWPVFQGYGIGYHLIRDVLRALRRMGANGCVVLGDPRYYERFGFRVVPGLVLPDVPPECFMAQAFGAEIPQGSVAYHAAFDA